MSIFYHRDADSLQGYCCYHRLQLDTIFFERATRKRLRTLSASSPSHVPDSDLIATKPSSSLRHIAGIALLAATYVLSGRLGFAASAVHPIVSSAWPPSGIALAALLLMGRRFWPAITIGAFVVNLTAGIAPLVAAGIAVGNTLEAVVAASLVTSIAGLRSSPKPLGRLRDVLGLVVLGAIASTTVSATIGVTVLTAFGGAPSIPYGTAWLAWWTGDAIGILLVTPFLLTWATGPRPRITHP